MHEQRSLSEWSDLFERWSRFLTHCAYSRRTRDAYTYQVKRFFSKVQLAPAEVSEAHITEWLARIPGNGAGRNSALRAIKCFYAWVEVLGYAEDPTKRLKVRDRKYGPPRVLSEEELQALVRAAMARERRRGLAIVLCYLTGARAVSLCRVGPEDVDLASCIVHLRGEEGDKTHPVPLSPRARAVVRELEALRPRGARTLLGVRPRTFSRWVHEAAVEAGLRASPKTLRYSFAAHLRLREVDTRTIEALLHGPKASVTQGDSQPDDRLMHQAVELLDEVVSG